MVIRPPAGKNPYAGTSVPADRSKAQITQLLRSYGVDGVLWVDNFATGEVQLRFVVTRRDGTAVGFLVTPAAFRSKHREWNPIKGKSEEREVPDWARSLRLLYAWVKVKLESIAYGLTTVEEEFLAQMVVRDGQGRETTAGRIVLPAIERGGGVLPIDGPRRGVVDGETGFSTEEASTEGG